MSDIREAIRLISGKEPSPEQVNRIQAIAHNCGFALNDAMMPVLIALDAYHGAFKELPGRAQQAADEITSNASKQTRFVVERTVAESLVPVATKAFKDGVDKYTGILEQAAAKKSMGMVAAAATGVLAVGLLVGWVGGSWSRGNEDRNAIEAAAVAQAGVASRLQATVNADQAVLNKVAADAAAVVAAADSSEKWARTEQGRLAFKFFTEGSGLAAVKCQSVQWERLDGKDGRHFCVPKIKNFWGSWASGGDGWVIP